MADTETPALDRDTLIARLQERPLDTWLPSFTWMAFGAMVTWPRIGPREFTCDGLRFSRDADGLQTNVYGPYERIVNLLVSVDVRAVSTLQEDADTWLAHNPAAERYVKTIRPLLDPLRILMQTTT